jgi:hypothetical protein
VASSGNRARVTVSEQNSTRLCSLSIYRLWRDREGWRSRSLHGFLSLVFRPSIQSLIHILWCMLEPSCICIVFLAYVSWVPANIMTGCSCYFWKCDRNLGCRFFVYILTWTFEKIIIDLSAASIRSWWHQWEVVAASHCHSWWKWFSGHKLVTWLFRADFVFLELTQQLPSNWLWRFLWISYICMSSLT